MTAENSRQFGVGGTVPGRFPSLLVQAAIAAALAIPLLISGPGWVRAVAAALSGGSLGAFALTCAVSLLVRGDAGAQQRRLAMSRSRS